MSVKANLQVIEHFYTACLAKDWDRAFDLVADSVVYNHPRFPTPRGHTTLRNHFEGFFRAFPDIRRDVLLRFSQDNWVCVETRYTGTNTHPLIRPSGKSISPTHRMIDVKELGVYKIEGGKITEIRLYEDLLTFRRQLRGRKPRKRRRL